jgi:Rrf2 family protein
MGLCQSIVLNLAKDKSKVVLCPLGNRARATPLASTNNADKDCPIFPKLEKAGIVEASEGVHGGYRLARAPQDITVLQVVDALEGPKPLFDCQEIRHRCATFEEQAPAWATDGICAIHAVMQSAEKAMRDELAAHTLANLAATVAGKAPATFFAGVQEWMTDRVGARKPGRHARTKPSP